MKHRGTHDRGRSELLEALFTQRWPNGYRGANSEVAKFVTDYLRLKKPMHRQYIYRLRRGEVSIMDGGVRDAICAFFEVPVTYFSTEPGNDDAAARDLADEIAETLRASGLRIAGTRPEGLSPAAEREVLRLVREIAAVVQDDARNTRR